MKSIKGIFLLLLASMAGLSTADFTDIIRDMCFLSFEQLPHPDPTLCFQYVQCIVSVIMRTFRLELQWQRLPWKFVDGVVLECPPGNIFVNSLPCVPGSWVTCEVDNPDIPILPTIDPIPTDPTDVPILPTIDPITTDPTIPTWPTEEPELPDDICEGINIGFLPDPRSCTRFILCIFEVPEVWHCFEPTPIFDPSRQQCVAGNKQGFLSLRGIKCSLWCSRQSRHLWNRRSNHNDAHRVSKSLRTVFKFLIASHWSKFR